MKRKISIIALLILILVMMAGCSKSDSEEKTEPAADTKTKSESVKKEQKETTFFDYVYEYGNCVDSAIAYFEDKDLTYDGDKKDDKYKSAYSTQADRFLDCRAYYSSYKRDCEIILTFDSTADCEEALGKVKDYFKAPVEFTEMYDELVNTPDAEDFSDYYPYKYMAYVEDGQEKYRILYVTISTQNNLSEIKEKHSYVLGDSDSYIYLDLDTIDGDLAIGTSTEKGQDFGNGSIYYTTEGELLSDSVRIGSVEAQVAADASVNEMAQIIDEEFDEAKFSRHLDVDGRDVLIFQSDLSSGQSAILLIPNLEGGYLFGDGRVYYAVLKGKLDSHSMTDDEITEQVKNGVYEIIN